MKKRLLALFLATSMAFTTVACEGKNDSESSSATDELLDKAKELEDDEDFEKAIKKYKKVLEEDDECVEAYIGMARCYIALDDMDSAKDILEKGLKKTDDDKDIQKFYDKHFDNDDDEDEESNDVEEVKEEAKEEVKEEEKEEVVEEDDERIVTISDDGSVLNIYASDTEFQEYVENCYPGYKKTGDETGKIGNVEVHWIVEYDTNKYYSSLNNSFAKQANGNLDEDEIVDLFIVDPQYSNYVGKLIDSDVSLAMSDIGLDNSVFSNQFQFTKDLFTTENGLLKGVAYNCCPGGLIYNRAIAREVLGTDDPDYVQDYVSDWDLFLSTAELMSDYGYLMTASYKDTYRVYSCNRSYAWVEDETIMVDYNLVQWANDARILMDMGATTSEGQWGNTWNSGLKYDNVFCYFGPDWFYNFSMKNYEESIASNGGWGLCEGPSSFYWGGVWVCVANGTDNASLCADLIRTMTTDDDVVTDVLETFGTFVNDKSVMNNAANDNAFENFYLGGENPFEYLVNNASSMRLMPITQYDSTLEEYFLSHMLDYLLDYNNLDVSLDEFFDDATYKFPNLDH